MKRVIVLIKFTLALVFFLFSMFMSSFNYSYAAAFDKQLSPKMLSATPVKIKGEWNDIAVKYDQPIKAYHKFKLIELIDDNKLVKVALMISGDTLYIHPLVKYEYNKKYSIVIPKNAIASINNGLCNPYKIVPFVTKNILLYNSLTKRDFIASANDFYNFMINNYPFLDITKNTTGYDFIKNKTAIIQLLSSSKNSEEFKTNMTSVINNLFPGTHTKLVDMTLYVPKDLTFVYINGEYIVNSSNNPDIQIGDSITSINDQPIDDYVKSSNNMLISDYDQKRNKLVAGNSVFLSPSGIKVSIENTNGENKDYNITLKSIKEDGSPIVQFTTPEPKVFTTRILSPDKIAYMKIPNFNTIDFNKIDDFLDSISNYSYLIVDVRNNLGGDLGFSDQLVTRLIKGTYSLSNYICLKNSSLLSGKYKTGYNFYDQTKVLTKEEKKKLLFLPDYIRNNDYDVYNVKINVKPSYNHFNGKVFILTNNYCFSACEYFCNTMKRIGEATLVGGYTGGDGILFIPDSKTFLNNSINLSYSYTIGIQDDGTINQLSHTAPNYYAEQSKDDYIKFLSEAGDFTNYDTILNKCLDIINQDSQ